MSSSSKSGTPRAYHNNAREHSERRNLRRSSGVYKVLPQSPKVHYPVNPDQLPLDSEENIEKFELLAEQIDEMETHMVNLQLIQEAISNGFNEPFASFMYGMSITMWCNNFPNRPSKEQWERLKDLEGVDNRLLDLSEQVRRKREENQQLKERLNSTPKVISQTRIEHQKPLAPPYRSKPTNLRPNEKFATPVSSTRTNNNLRRLQPSNRNAHPVQRHPSSDDTFNSNDSFIENPRVSKIPHPIRSTHIGQPSNRSFSRNNTGPDLNQEPRYLRGLFDKSNTSRNERFERNSKMNTRRVQTHKVNKLSSRPPFR